MPGAETDTSQHVKVMKTPVPHDQHIGLNLAQQALATSSFTDGIRPENRIENGMGATLAQVDTLHLRKGTFPTSRTGSSEISAVGLTVGHLIHAAIQSHQPQAISEGTERF